MEQSKRERWVLYGAVPMVAACLGGVVTVAAGHFFGAAAPSDAMLAVLKMDGITVDQRLKLLEQVNLGTSRFYSFLNTAGVILLMPTAGILWSWAAKIRG
jgi:hypothetical protein